MKKEKRSLKNEEELNIQANLNNLEPGDSVNKQRALETGNLILAHDEIQQQNDNL
jgi:hypothetical protein